MQDVPRAKLIVGIEKHLQYILKQLQYIVKQLQYIVKQVRSGTFQSKLLFNTPLLMHHCGTLTTTQYSHQVFDEQEAHDRLGSILIVNWNTANTRHHNTAEESTTVVLHCYCSATLLL